MATPPGADSPPDRPRGSGIALRMRTVTCIIVPNDLPAWRRSSSLRTSTAPCTRASATRRRRSSRRREIRRARRHPERGRAVAILAGQGALRASDEVIETRDRLGAGVAKALLGRAVVPDDLPFVTGSIGLLGTRPSYELMSGCDTLLMVGSSFPYSEFLPEEGKARGVQIDIDARMIGIRYPMDVNLVGDARRRSRALLPLLQQKEDRSWQERIENEVAEWWELMDDRAHRDADPINPQRVFWELSSRLPDNAILAADSGSAANWFARDLKLRRGMMATLSGTLATMGCGVPYAIAAKFAHPDRPAIALVGDGAMQMNGLNELITVAKYWQHWSDPRLVVLVLNNRDLNQVTWEQRAMQGDPMYPATQAIPDFPYARFAELVGLPRLPRATTRRSSAMAWDAGSRADRPAVLEAIVDPEVPPLPPHISFEQARHFAQAALSGDPRRGRMIRQSLKQMVGALTPGR
jgi:pyruvate dehydrogenase (quinone)